MNVCVLVEMHVKSSGCKLTASQMCVHPLYFSRAQHLVVWSAFVFVSFVRVLPSLPTLSSFFTLGNMGLLLDFHCTQSTELELRYE